MKDKILPLKLVCFSPTGTTKKIIQCIAHGTSSNVLELIDITKPEARKQSLQTTKNELLIVGVPVYMGRVPAIATKWLQTIKAHHTPAVCIVVYGNRAYEDALLELKDTLIVCGCKPIAGAAYIGEHSFSCLETPTAEKRPDTKDLNHAELFGQKINEKLQSLLLDNYVSDILISGNYPYRNTTQLWSVDFITIDNKCTKCGICADCCPVGAIDSATIELIDNEKCITCCACIKNCPQNARTIKDSLVKDASIRLNRLYRMRKEPILFL